MKVMPLTREELDFMADELNVLLSLDHPNVVTIFDWFESVGKLLIVTEFCPGGSLLDWMFSDEALNLPEDRIYYLINRITQHSLSGLAYCHSHGVVHRDIKPDNIMFGAKGPPDVRLVDFGCADVVGVKDHGGLAGTPGYMAPESCVPPYDFDARVDIFGLGIVLYSLLTGEHAFFEEFSFSPEEYCGNIGMMDLRMEPIATQAQEVQDLIASMLRPKDTRITAQGALEHPWFATTRERWSVEQKTAHNLIVSRSAFKNMRNFSKLQVFEKAVLTQIAHQSCSTEVEHLRKLFFDLDVKKDGVISRDELKEGFQRFNDRHADEGLDTLIFEAMDTAEVGEISYTEFLAAALDVHRVATDDVVQRAFQVFNMNQDGHISRAELEAVLGPNDAEATLALVGGAESQDQITLDEFRRLVASIGSMQTALTQEMVQAEADKAKPEERRKPGLRRKSSLKLGREVSMKKVQDRFFARSTTGVF
jgi:calcium-dependent protein kinase